jgi:hypothetical protein
LNVLLELYTLQVHQVDCSLEIVEKGGLGLVYVTRILLHLLFELRLVSALVGVELLL